MPDEKKPDGWEQLRRDGDPRGLPEVGYDPHRGHFHIRGDGAVVWHEKPAGFGFRAGVLVPTTPETHELAQTPAESVAAGIKTGEVTHE